MTEHKKMQRFRNIMKVALSYLRSNVDDVNEALYDEETNSLHTQDGYMPQITEEEVETLDNELWGQCQRCGSNLFSGRCMDQTCPFSDYDQDDPKGWIGHPNFNSDQ